MTDFDMARIVAETAGDNPVTLVAPDAPEARDVPEPWRPIVSSSDPATRAATALRLWNQDFLTLVPRFAELFRERLVDVRVCRLAGDWALVYAARADEEPYVSWIGWEPDPLTETRPPFWDNIPAPARTFMTTVHGGFTSSNWESHGFIRPKWMKTLAQFGQFDDTTNDQWNAEAHVAADRMTIITTNGSILYYCVSPDIPPDRIILLYEGDIDDRSGFFEGLDELWCEIFE